VIDRLLPGAYEYGHFRDVVVVFLGAAGRRVSVRPATDTLTVVAVVRR
jgi:hypothetical protein